MALLSLELQGRYPYSRVDYSERLKVHTAMITQLRLHSPNVALVDGLRQERASASVQVLGIVGFALLAVLGAQVRIYLWEIPITFQTLAIYGSGLYLGWRNGLLAMLLYLTLGLFFPVFVGDGYGPAYLFGAATAGYLMAAPFSSAIIGYLSKQWNAFSGSVLSLLVGSAILFIVGVTWLHYAADHATWLESIDKGWLRFILPDLAKILVVAGLYTGTRRFSSEGA